MNTSTVRDIASLVTFLVLFVAGIWSLQYTEFYTPVAGLGALIVIAGTATLAAYRIANPTKRWASGVKQPALRIVTGPPMTFRRMTFAHRPRVAVPSNAQYPG